jgi:hypothetical protein
MDGVAGVFEVVLLDDEPPSELHGEFPTVVGVGVTEGKGGLGSPEG